MTKTLTPAQQKGFEIGKLYRVFQNSPDCSYYQKVGQVVKFNYDDGSSCPGFIDEKNDSFYIYLSDLEPYEQPTTTKQKLSPQELLLMYVKQHYPEDRVMIAMVESI